MEFEIFYGTDNQLFQECRRIRMDVFVKEQKVDLKLELDGQDDQRFHIIVFDGERAVATARFYESKPGQLKLQRVCVLSQERGKNYGRLMIQEIEKWAIDNNFNEIILSAQTHALSFYEKIGYQKHGQEYLEAGILHYDMSKII